MALPTKNGRKIWRYDGNTIQASEDIVASEYALTLVLDDEELVTMVCTPADLKPLVIGYLCSEGLVDIPQAISDLTIDEDQGMAYITTSGGRSLNRDLMNKRYLTSCCGKSRQSFYFYNDARLIKPVSGDVRLTAADACRLIQDMQNGAFLFHETGGVHNAALGLPDRLLYSFADIGRHNALDKLYGHALLHNIPTHDKIMIFSGRISSEVLLKAAKMQIPVLLSKSAPTEMALDIADQVGITTAGFIRGQSFNIYTHPERFTDFG